MDRLKDKVVIVTGSTSGIIKAADPAAMVEEMISALRRAWDELHG